MAGHSKWANIKRTKGANDLKKSSQYSKLSKDITNAVRFTSNPNINSNSMLRVAVEKAKDNNMSSDKINYAIDKGLGKFTTGSSIFENTYEAYDAFGNMLLIDTETDNPNRTVTEIKNFLNKNEGKFVQEGSISWQFDELVRFKLSYINWDNRDNLAIDILDLGLVEDLSFDEESKLIIIFCKKELVGNLMEKVEGNFNELNLSEVKIIKKAKNTINLSKLDFSKQIDFINSMQEYIPEIIDVWSNTKNE